MDPMEIVDLDDDGDGVDAYSDSELEPPRRWAEMKQLAISVYSEVWKEFYTWEPEECKNLMKELVDHHPFSERALDLEAVIQAISKLGVCRPPHIIYYA
jgi:hypothetical protein